MDRNVAAANEATLRTRMLQTARSMLVTRLQGLDCGSLSDFDVQALLLIDSCCSAAHQRPELKFIFSRTFT